MRPIILDFFSLELSKKTANKEAQVIKVNRATIFFQYSRDILI
jgi:hypothetical protein